MGSKATIPTPPVAPTTSPVSEPPAPAPPPPPPPPPARSPPPMSATPTPTPIPVEPDPPPAKATPEPVVAVAPSENTVKPSFYSVVIAANPDLEPKEADPSLAVRRWYKWSQREQQKRDPIRTKWYLNPKSTPDETPPVVATGKISIWPKDVSKEITAPPTYQLRSTAIYSPPHGDRILPGRLPYSDEQTWNFKYYHPDQRANETSANHSKAVMYQMNTRAREVPTVNRSTSSVGATPGTDVAPALPTFVSRGLQTDLEPPTSASQTTYFEKQPAQIVPLSDLTSVSSTVQGFYHLSSSNPTSAAVLPPIEKTPMWSEDQQPTSILKNPSSSVHAQVAEEVRKNHQEIKDGTYRVKKVHVLEKKTPARVSFNVRPKSSKASQSIAKSEQLFSGQVLQRKK